MICVFPGLSANPAAYRRSRRSPKPSATSPPHLAQQLLVEALARIGVRRHPMPSNIEPTRHPNAVLPHNIVEQPLQAGGPSRVSNEAHVQPDGHHLRRLGTLFVEHVERVANEIEPLVR